MVQPIRSLPYAALALLALLLVGCGGRNPGGIDVGTRLENYQEEGCENGPATDRHGLDGLSPGGCASSPASDRELDR